MVGAGRIAEGGPDPAEALGDQLLVRQRLVGRVPLAARPLVQPLGERLGEPVGERLDHDRAVVVVLGLEAIGELVAAVDRDRERADVVREPVSAGATKSASERFGRESPWSACWRSIGKRDAVLEHDVVALGARRPEAVDAARLQRAVRARSRRAARSPPSKSSRATAPFSGSSRIAGIPALQLPGVEEELPVDVLAQRREVRLDEPRARERRRREVVHVPVDRRSARRVPREREQRLAPLLGVQRAEPLLVSCGSRRRAAPRRSASSRSATTPTTRDASRTCTVGWPYSGAIRTAVCCFEVVAPPIRSGRSRPRRSISFATSTISSSDGVIRPERPTTSQPSSTRGVEDPVRRHHHAEVDHLVVVAAEHDADDVLADVVHVALDGREHDPAPRRERSVFSASMYGSRYATARFIARALFTTCGRNIFPEPKRSPTIFIPSISGPSITSSGRAELLPRLLGVLLDEVDDPVDERVREPLLDRRLAPGEVELALRRPAGDGRRVLDEPLGRVGAAVEEDVLDALEQVRLDVLVDGELAGVDDAHVEPRADRVVEERRVHRLAHGVVAAEREREVRDAAARRARPGSAP